MLKSAAAVLLTVSFVLTGAYRPCKKIDQRAPLDEAWLKEVGPKGFYSIQHSDCENCEKDEGWTWLKGRSDVQKLCWKIDLDTLHGPFTLPLNCEYYGPSKVNHQNCVVDFSKTGIKDPPSVTGTFSITLTDNSTYVAGVGCFNGKENSWFFVATTPTVSPAIQKLVTDHFESELGFRAPVAVKGKSPVFFNKFYINANEC